MKNYKKLSQLGLKARWTKEYQKTEEYILKNKSNFKLEKARLIGFLMGDGSLTSKQSNSKFPHHDIRFYPDDIELAKLFVKDFKKIYLKKPTIKKLKNHFRVHVSSRPAWEDLNKIAGFSSLEWDLPKKYFRSKEEKIIWLRALFDCEGYVGKRAIQLQSVNLKGISSIKKTLLNIGITSSIYNYTRKNPNWNVNYILSITKKDNLIKFSNLVGFDHSLKKEKIKKYLPMCQSGNGTVSKTVPLGAPRFKP